MPKKLLSLLLIIALIVSFSSCTKPVRVDFSELLLRMEKELNDYSLDIENAFFSEQQWFLFVSAVTSDDILITAKEDENKFITDVGISVINTGDTSVIPVYINFCEAAGNALLYNTDTKALLTESALYEENTVFSENTYFAQLGRYKVSFFNAEMGSTVLYQIKA